MAAYDAKRLTDNVAVVLDRAIAIARRELAQATRADALWAEAHTAIGRIPSGHWTSVTDVAELVHTSTGWVGRHFYGKWELDGLHRLFEADGVPWRWFHWPPDADREDVLTVLRAEGAIPVGSTTGDETRRLRADDLRKLL